MSTTRYSVAHGLLASLPSREAVTTNYDSLFELAIEPVDGLPAVLPYEPVTAGQRWLLKLHGSVDREESIVLTREDYLGVPLRHGALFGLVQAMLLTRYMLFVGYSLTDEDFHQLIHEVRAARRGMPNAPQIGMALTLFDDPLFAELWSGDLDIVPMAPLPASGSTEEERRAATVRAARLLQIFLDHVAYKAADLNSFLLDSTYDDMLPVPDERSLRDALVPLLQAARGQSGPGWDQVAALLSDFGA